MLNWILNQSLYKIVLVILCCMLFISACIYIFIYLFIYLVFSFTIVIYVCYLLWNDFMCILLHMIMCMLLSATNTHFKWELMLYCLHCPTLNKVFLLLLLLLLLLLPTPQPQTRTLETRMKDRPPQTEVSTNSCGRPWTSHQNGQSQSDRPRAQYVATQDPLVHRPAVTWLWGINLIRLI